MHLHVTAHRRDFAVLPNALLQNRGLSFTARGLLCDLLSRPDGWCEDGRRMADSSPQGRTAVHKALKELREAGYYHVLAVRLPDGKLRSEVHVYDTPQYETPRLVAPTATIQGPGAVRPGSPVSQKRKNRGKVPTPLPTRPVAPDPPAEPDPVLREAVAALYRVIRPERRLRLGEAEALQLAPLVASWLERGSTLADLAQALLPTLPTPLHSPLGLLRDRLQRKMPPVPGSLPAPLTDPPTAPPTAPSTAPPTAPPTTPPPERAECTECNAPVAGPGRCGRCAGRGTPVLAIGGGHAATAVGAANARAALRATREQLRSATREPVAA
ncbi:helix-turn-helix domain-containing protein [Kitasatospora sp. NBC_01287]|uniref:hypothetical protein n=1 Tax=Kitasatospora sp. NBC_01287 TaxID=2903573 RepID=UPI00224E120B|nr:hypothetical protein [Kitasatospora sp. NBC_01287]MCX4747202.1 helix-turn-helix domain-containing protein [Kitasatospora sp. NBC_01287]